MGDIARTAAELAGSGRGILAADESGPALSRRLERAGVAPTAHHRRAYRELLVTTPHLSEGVSGVLLADETFRQRITGGPAFPQVLAAAGLLAGIRADTGARPLAGAPGEQVTEGLDGLRDRLAEYLALGARFARWRAVFLIGGQRPSWPALRANAHALARFARLCHEAGLVPMVEADVLMAGEHAIQSCSAVTSAVLLGLVAELRDFDVALDGVVLRLSMVVPGAGSGVTAAPREVAAQTVRALAGIVPAQVAGITFLSGGQGPATATANLAALLRTPVPWPLTFAFGRALADPALAAWRGEPGRVRAG
ncbi:MAG: class I fructose-bisphosphate aldolase, partial [Streptosporangiaceae bacterium]